MGEPARKLDDDLNQLSASERARRSWGIPGGYSDNESQNTPEVEEKSALQRAKDSWGEAGVIDGGKDKTSNDKEGSDSSESEIPFRDEGERGKRLKGKFLNKKTAIGGGIAGLLIGGGFGIFGILSGPMQIIHFSQLLQQFHFSNNEDFSDSRTSRYLYHRLRGVDTGGPGYAKMRTRLGVVGNRVADVMEIKMQKENGLRSLYDTRTGTLVGYEMVSRDRAISAIMSAGSDPDLDWQTLAPNELPGSISVVGADGNGIGGSNHILLARPSESQSVAEKIKEIGRRRGFQKNLTKSVGLNKVAAAVGFRKTAARGRLDLTPWRRLDQAINQSVTEALRGRWRNEARNGATIPGDLTLGNTDSEGNEISGDDAEARRQAEAEGRASQNDARTSAETGDIDGARTRMARGIAAGTLGIGTLCAARSISENIGAVKHANIVMPLMRVGTRVVAMGSQVMTGQDVTMEEIGVFGEMLHDKELGSWASARSIQAEQGQPATGTDIPATAKPSRVNERPLFLEIVDNIFNAIPGVGSTACSSVGQFILGAATGGVIANTIQEVVGRAASAAGVNPIDAFASWLVNVLAGEEVNVDAVGADLGNIANYGARLAANEQALSMGGAQLSSEDVVILDAYRKENALQEFQQKNFLARTLDLSEPNSVAAKALFDNTTLAFIGNPGSLLGSLFNAIPSVGKNISKITMPKTYAQSSYDYGFDEFGFTLDEQESELVDDPYANAEYVESRLAELTERYGDCFSTMINPATYAIEGNEVTRYDEIPDYCSDRGNEELVRYRFYIADMVLAKSLSCYEGLDDAACTELGFDGSGNGSNAGNQIPANPGEDTSSQQCPNDPEITDGGIAEKHSVGGVLSHRIRICLIRGNPGFDVNVSIAQNVINMVRAAETDGIQLIGGAYRSFEEQVNLRTTNGCANTYTASPSTCSPPTARPGESNHEEGLAIDFKNCSSRSTRCFQWLSQNAANYGLINLPSEPWHWSVTGG